MLPALARWAAAAARAAGKAVAVPRE